MKLAIRFLMMLLVLGIATTATAQTTEKAPKAPKAAKATKTKKAKKADASAPAAVAPTPAPVAPSPSPAPAAPSPAPAPVAGTVIDPVTGQAVPEKLTTIQFDEVSFDFGKIKEGETVKHKFRFTNTGTNDLILENVKPSCGCTALDWPKDPIAPGKSGEIEAQFNSTGKAGPQMKYITITLNSAERLERITFTGEVIPKPVEGGAPAPTPAPSSGH
jgi:biotin carboxyl carrier protein